MYSQKHNPSGWDTVEAHLGHVSISPHAPMGHTSESGTTGLRSCGTPREQQLLANQPDTVVVDHQGTAAVIDEVIPADSNARKKKRSTRRPLCRNRRGSPEWTQWLMGPLGGVI